MAQPKLINWIAADTAAIAALQTLAAAGSLQLNGTLAADNIGYPFILLDGTIRDVTLTSVNNLSAVNFTITGTTDGHPNSEVLAGPNNNTVISVGQYESITSITTSAPAAAVSVGIGHEGATKWLAFDYNKSVANLGILVDVSGTINYSFAVTLDNVNTTIFSAVTPFAPIAAMTNATTRQYASFSGPISYYRVFINSSVTNASLSAIFCQQGLS